MSAERRPRSSDPLGDEPRDSGPQRAAPLYALFATVTWGALAFAVDGLLTIALDRDLIEGGAPRLSGLFAVAVTGILIWLVLTFATARPTPWWGIVLAAAAGYLGPVAAALPTGLGLVFEQALSPFVGVSALIAGSVALAAWAVLRRERIATAPDPRKREW